MGTADNKNSSCFSEIITDFVDKGGYGGIIKIILAFVVFVILLFSKIELKEILWNVFILDIPCLIDCIEFRSVPKSELTKSFIAMRGWLIVFLTITVLGAVIAWVLLNSIDITFGADFWGWVFKFTTSLSVAGAIFNFIGKVHIKDFQMKKSEKT